MISLKGTLELLKLGEGRVEVLCIHYLVKMEPGVCQIQVYVGAFCPH